MNRILRSPQSRYQTNAARIDIRRSKFAIENQHTFNYNSGVLYPAYFAEVMPGDTVDMKLSFVNRMTTPIKPVLDTAYLDYAFYYVPYRLIWDNYEKFEGASDDAWYDPGTEYEVPQLTVPADGWKVGDLAEMFGLPIGIANADGSRTVSALPFRAYVKIWNDWYRSGPIMDQAFFVKSDSTRAGKHYVWSTDLKNGSLVNFDTAIDGGCPLPPCKLHDRFTSGLPEPQRGPAVGVPLLGSTLLPVGAGPESEWFDATGTNSGLIFTSPEGPLEISAPHNVFLNTESLDGVKQLYVDTADYSPAEQISRIVPANLTAKLDQDNAIFSDVNTIRTAFAMQRFYETMARAGGSRYTEILEGIWGVHAPDSSLQRSEFLGGDRVSVNMQQVVQMSASDFDTDSPQGNVAGLSNTSHVDNSCFVKSFSERGIIIGLVYVRNVNTYTQGLDPIWTRKSKFDFYLPQFANIGEQPVLCREICETGDPDIDNEVFCYQEAWIDYRTKMSYATGDVRPNASGSLRSWTYEDYYKDTVGDPRHGCPVLSPEWLVSSGANIANTLAVPSEKSFIAQFYFRPIWTRPMPLYSVPGLIDHH